MDRGPADTGSSRGRTRHPSPEPLAAGRSTGLDRASGRCTAAGRRTSSGPRTVSGPRTADDRRTAASYHRTVCGRRTASGRRTADADPEEGTVEDSAGPAEGDIRFGLGVREASSSGLGGSLGLGTADPADRPGPALGTPASGVAVRPREPIAFGHPFQREVDSAYPRGLLAEDLPSIAESRPPLCTPRWPRARETSQSEPEPVDGCGTLGSQPQLGKQYTPPSVKLPGYRIWLKKMASVSDVQATARDKLAKVQ